MDYPALPRSFPCWVKAVYSFGGETKRDLGFLEGDYIECLNAGDGSWWTGRLKRDPRIIGKFPSNFVKVLNQDAWPVSRNASPIPLRSDAKANTPPSSGNNSPAPRKSKSMFRKPFSAHTAANAPTPETNATESRPKPAAAKSYAPKPYSSMKKPETNSTPPKSVTSRPPSPRIPQPIARGGTRHPISRPAHPSRAPSPQPPSAPLHSRAPSPQPPFSQMDSRASSPQPHFSRAASPLPTVHNNSHDGFDVSPESSPPPPPPAHRTVYNRIPRQEMGAGLEYSEEYAQHYQPYRPPRTPSPSPAQHTGLTPSPLRDAMEDVMTSLDGMGVDNGRPSESGVEDREAPSVWSPDAFNEVYTRSAQTARPHSSLGFANEVEYDENGAMIDPQSPTNLHMPPSEDHNRMRDYVQRMESRLSRLQRSGTLDATEDAENDQPPAPPVKGGTMPSRPGSAFGFSRKGSSRAARSRPGSSHGDSEAPTDSTNDHPRPTSSYLGNSSIGRAFSRRGLRERKSAYELGRDKLARTFTTKSSVTTASSTAQSTSTNHSNSTQATSQSLMSGASAGGFSATSAGSLARRKFGADGPMRPMSVMEPERPDAMSGYSYHSSHQSNNQNGFSQDEERGDSNGHGGLLGGLSAPVTKKRNLFQRLRDTAKTSAASARSNISSSPTKEQPPRPKSMLANGITAISGGVSSRDTAKEMGLGCVNNSNGVDWVQMRRDVNRSNSLSQNERGDRMERCQMLDIPVLNPADVLYENVEGDEAADGEPVPEPTDFQACNLAMVDKSARFVANLPSMINATSLAQSYVCRPYRSDVQKLRAIFTWVSERISWEDDFEGEVNARRVIQTKRGSSEEIAFLVAEMCNAVGIHAEMVHGFLKKPGQTFSVHDLSDAASHPNHWWNAVIADGEWRIIDCSLASPSNPRRAAYSSAGGQIAETFWFLAKPLESCYTHVPLMPEQQHIVPPIGHDVLMTLPVACPPFFKAGCRMWDFNTSILHLEGLEMVHVQLAVPDDVECVAEVESHAFAQDADGDYFESGDFERKRALAQAEFVTVPDNPAPFKRYTIKAVLPSNANTSPQGVLRIYAGRRGLMHGIQNNPHPLAVALPLSHSGKQNPPYDFFMRHPTPHALRHELYVTGPLCQKLALNNTFVFGVRQHPASPNSGSHTASGSTDRSASPTRPTSAMSIARPSSALSMASVSASGSAYSNPSNASDGSNSSNNATGVAAREKPAKLAIQSPSGKILRMNKKPDHSQQANKRGRSNGPGGTEQADGGVARVGGMWETIIKIGERGTWRGLVLADRSARWCVFGEWEAV